MFKEGGKIGRDIMNTCFMIYIKKLFTVKKEKFMLDIICRFELTFKLEACKNAFNVIVCAYDIKDMVHKRKTFFGATCSVQKHFLQVTLITPFIKEQICVGI